jgi:hypothetical protein
MKNLILSIAVLVLFSFTLNAQVATQERQINTSSDAQQKKPIEQTENTAQPDNLNAPEIEFDKLVHDYGTMEQHGDGKCEFKFTNTGKEPLILSNVRSSCGCTVPEWPRQPVLPGQSEVINVKYDTKRIGMINKSIHVYSNAKTSPVTLKITGKIDAKSESVLPEKQVDNTAAPINK